MASTLVERMRKVFHDEKTADVLFDVGNPTNGTKRRIFAHLNVLKPASEAFEAMFSVKFRNEKIIAVPDADPDAFVEMLRYVYTDHATINVSNALDILYLSQEYLLPGLSSKVIHFTKQDVDAENVCSFLPYAHIFDDIHDSCWEIVDMETPRVIRSDAFLSLDLPHLLEIVRRDTLAVGEATLFEYVVKWAAAKMKW